jgi:hypothetical protein
MNIIVNEINDKVCTIYWTLEVRKVLVTLFLPSIIINNKIIMLCPSVNVCPNDNIIATFAYKMVKYQY